MFIYIHLYSYIFIFVYILLLHGLNEFFLKNKPRKVQIEFAIGDFDGTPIAQLEDEKEGGNSNSNSNSNSSSSNNDIVFKFNP